MSSRTPTLPHDDAAALIRWTGADDDDLRALARAAARLDALFVIEETRSLVVVGAVFVVGARLSATGAGRDRRAALGACLGEAVETLAQAPAPGDEAVRAPGAAPPPGAAPGFAARLTTAQPVGWMRALRLADGLEGLVPAPLVLRGLEGGDGAPLSLGCAAGTTPEAARRAGVLELIERAAAVGWRADPSRARALHRPPADVGAWMARIEPDGWLPVVAAVSAFGEGVAAGETEAEAAAAALRELSASEAAARFAAARGGATPVPRALPPAPEGTATHASGSLSATLSRPAWSQRALWSVDLTRPSLGASVVKVLASGPHSG